MIAFRRVLKQGAAVCGCLPKIKGTIIRLWANVKDKQYTSRQPQPQPQCVRTEHTRAPPAGRQAGPAGSQRISYPDS